LLLAAAFCIARSDAAGIETLLMPGKVSDAHAKYEETCNNCHDRTNRDRQSALCMDCHKEVGADVRSKKGFHGRLTNIDRAQCRACHAEHQGRDADIVHMSIVTFQHDNTDYPLHGQHSLVDCATCHTQGKKYSEASSRCIDCHRKDEPHDGKLGNDCGNCHSETTWNKAKFDHSKTKYALHDKHVDVPCLACHFGNRYKGTPTQCVSCHAPDDVHRTGRGVECNKCHTTTGWKTTKFDHFKETKFALEGAHADIDCRGCHKTGRMEDKIPKDCHGCHAADDFHASRLGDDCGKCHSARAWKPQKFDHDRDTKFALVGAHTKVDCHTCHTAIVGKQKLGTTCESCHRAQDIHAGKLGKNCEQCHQSEGWRVDVAFDHDLSSFPLVGLHVAIPCAQCHQSPSYKGVGKECNDCHAHDDVHKGGLGKQCAECHSPNGWGIWEFDHAKKTHFALTGAHAKLTCGDCHKQPAGDVKLSMECGACHVQDDVHLGQFGKQCERCHTTVSFRGTRTR
ncbi:MAG TPA: hypothetical protein VET48_11735, partial [Steroidobacteraceae bacterium]|nr:hypothetical protein [Steroidobacteraceae bacterium]